MARCWPEQRTHLCEKRQTADGATHWPLFHDLQMMMADAVQASLIRRTSRVARHSRGDDSSTGKRWKFLLVQRTLKRSVQTGRQAVVGVPQRHYGDERRNKASEKL